MGVTSAVKLELDKDLILKTIDRHVRVELKVATYGKKHFDDRRKSGNGKEKGIKMKDGKKEEKIWKLYENLNTINCPK